MASKIATAQILQASMLGTEAHRAGAARVPGADTKLMAMIAGRKNFETPEGEASSAAIMAAWLKAWDAARIASMLGK